MALLSSCTTDPVPVDEDIVNTNSFSWVAGNTMTWESTSVDPEETDLDTTTQEFLRTFKNADTTIEEWTNHLPKGQWGRTLAVRLETGNSNWRVQGYYPTSRGESWDRVDSMILTNESGQALRTIYLRIRTVTADTVITTPAGSFRCASYVHEWFTREGASMELMPREFYWYAPRVGLIQRESWYTPSTTNIPERTTMSRIIKITR
ncbi:MAG TPA: hypothetical protein VK147_09035 [Candidatus Didemnitutus sp.]|nr:hypothetical protein [Candidatus Didemnitutus sp.]